MDSRYDDTRQHRDSRTRGAPTSGTVVSRLMLGFMTTQLVRTALDLELPDRIAEGTLTVQELAEQTETHAQSLGRVLRGLAAIGLADETEPGRFGLTAAGSRLRKDGYGSLHAMAKVFSDDSMTKAWYDLTECVRTGEPAFDRVFGAAYYEYLERDEELSRLFHDAHGQGTRRAAESVAAAYDFSGVDTVVDVGGGDGTLLAAVLASAPGLRGVVYDTAGGVTQTRETLTAAGVADRCAIRTGDFRTEVPAGADLYLLKSTIHNWDDDHAVTILRNCRKAVVPHGRLVLVESVLPPAVDPAEPPFAYLSDLNMLVNLGGREHTAEEFRGLLAAAGFDLVGVRPVPDAPNLGLSLIEGVPA